MDSGPCQPGSRGTWSIATRLIVLFASATAVLLCAVMVLLYGRVEQHLREEHESLVAEIVRIFDTPTSEQDGAVAPLVETVAAVARNQPSTVSDPYCIRVVDSAGHVLAEMPGMSEIPPDAFRAAPTMLARGLLQGIEWQSPRQEWYLLAKALGGGRGASARYTVQVALNVSRDRVLLATLRKEALALLLMGVAGSVAAGAVVSRHGLRPVGRIAFEASQITGHQLRRRLAVGRWPRELTSLVVEFDRMLDRLEVAFARLSEFSANIAHELRTPLSNLRGEAEMALLRARSPEEYREVLASSLEEYQRLSRLIDGLLFLARAESREATLSRKALDAAQEVRAVAEFYRPLADEVGVDLTVRGNAALEADPDLFRRALANLLANALRFVPRGGRVEVEVAGDRSSGVEVRVVDDGCGIRQDDLPHVCERFYRGANSRGRDRDGSGMGLAIVTSIMELHGGSVTLVSTVGKGTAVTLRFPPCCPG